MMKSLTLGLAGMVLTAGALVAPAHGVAPFGVEFKGLYVKPDGSDADKAFAAMVLKGEKVQCGVCHVGDEKKKLNPYGKELHKHLDRKKHAKDPAAIQAALKTVEAAKPKADGPTFGELIKQGKHPSGE